jgi:hypothetical protein
MVSQMLLMTSACCFRPTFRQIHQFPVLQNHQCPVVTHPSSHFSPQLRESEQQVLPIRMQELQERLSALQAKESEYQARYSQMSRAMAAQ